MVGRGARRALVCGLRRGAARRDVKAGSAVARARRRGAAGLGPGYPRRAPPQRTALRGKDQRPAEGRDLEKPLDTTLEEADEGWRRALILASSATAAELVDPALPAWRLVDRLYLAEGVRIYRPHAMTHRCRCSRQRVADVLCSLPAAEVDELKIDDKIEVRCEFCNRAHVFDSADLEALRTRP